MDARTEQEMVDKLLDVLNEYAGKVTVVQIFGCIEMLKWNVQSGHDNPDMLPDDDQGMG